MASTTVPSTLATMMSATSSLPYTLNASNLPLASDSAPGGANTQPSSSSSTADANQSHHADNNDGLINYYFIFLALIVCVIGLAVFLIWRRKRKVIMHISHSRQNALARDVGGWGTGRRYWHGGWRGAEASREEGLNEHGEAPPPYMPKTGNGRGREDQGGPAAGGLDGYSPAVPLQTLSRNDAGLKPPDYAEANVRPLSDGEASGSRHQTSVDDDRGSLDMRRP